MSSSRCFACYNGIINEPYPHRCDFCGGTGWKHDVWPQDYTTFTPEPQEDTNVEV